MNNGATVLQIRDLRTYFYTDEGVVKAVDGVDLSVEASRTIGIIGESGSGKSVTAQSILRIVPPPGRTVAGSAVLTNTGFARDLLAFPPNGEDIRAVRGKDISMIFQEPMTSLSPVHTIGRQIEEMVLLHRTTGKREARTIALEMLHKVGINNAAQRLREWPHQLSGGMRQRVMIAMALSCHPAILIADEPTTALDVTVQAQIIDLMQQLQEEMGMAMIYITHDLGVISEVSKKIAVMYLGRIVEHGSRQDIFRNALHPYTRLLMKSIPRLGKRSRTRLQAIAGTVPIPLDMPVECGFASRCPDMMAGRCDTAVPALTESQDGHLVRCFLHSDRVEDQATNEHQ